MGYKYIDIHRNSKCMTRKETSNYIKTISAKYMVTFKVPLQTKKKNYDARYRLNSFSFFYHSSSEKRFAILGE